ncbi:hypothetical protein [Alloscardovia omnicolens]
MANSKYSEQEVAFLYDEAKLSGWQSLSRGERIAVGRYCRKNNLEVPDAAGLVDVEMRAAAHRSHTVSSQKPSTHSGASEGYPYKPKKKHVEQESAAQSSPAKNVDPIVKKEPVQPSASLESKESLAGQTVLSDQGVLLGTFIDKPEPALPRLNTIQLYYYNIAHVLKENPNHWLLLARPLGSKRSALNAAGAIRRAKTKTWKAEHGHFEAVMQMKDEEYYVAARFVKSQE